MFLQTLAVMAFLLLALPAHGMERVTLSSGFAMDYHHSAELTAGRLRLFLDGTESSYIDVETASILSHETVPDPAPNTAPQADATLHGGTVAPAAQATVASLLAKQGEVHHLNVDLLKSVVAAESGGQIRAVSRTGAQGLMQLMPATARSLGVTDSFAPDQNLRGGTTYLDTLLVRYHDNLALALAAYNAGPAAVDHYHGVPPYRETQLYVARIIREFNRRTLLAQRAGAAVPAR